ncbi:MULTISPECIES: glycosyltransferase family 2 protein [Aequorivita]|uniref:Glycosyltransferase family 2 protein n=1 Tax=Aequorivita iocasae TaxID=2803865 RepID=A0ABX7DT47_9FLAO|nr:MULTISPECIES: glycosyltransferase family 2 protein [Aequorivita]QQX77178.1 glycosyltransferase family 2 protein [Aequorivita iocasae]UCA56666.1 glycosyltransferase family 2 protein [Aequorivita sp. F7]
MNFYIVIPAHNEEAFISGMLQSMVEQTVLPKKVVVVDDASTDGTSKIIQQFSEKYTFIEGVFHNSQKHHEPGSKVINAFYKGFEALDKNFDIICKFDADLIFPKNYLEKIAVIFQQDPAIGMAGGFCYIVKNGEWVLENLTNKDHIRGALKAYRKECFEQINGLKNTMGWDTVDELLAQYHGWKIKTDTSLQVKHLKPTGKVYSKASKYKQGEAFYKIRYGFWLTLIASAKLASKKNSFSFFMESIWGYFKAKKSNLEYLLSEEEGKFVRKLRWKKIREKLGMR